MSKTPPQAMDGPSTLASMTGYASRHGATEGVRWMLEARSVNGRGLDIKTRIPSSWDALDAVAKQAARTHLVRGNVSISVQIETERPAGALVLNEVAVRDLADFARRTEAIIGQPVSLEHILTMRGVLETGDGGADDQQALIEHALPLIDADLDRLLAALAAARQAEGRGLAAILSGHANTIDSLTTQAEQAAAEVPALIQSRLRALIAELTAEGAVPVTEERLAQEIVMAAAKADVREEIDRLRVHVDSLRDLLAMPRGIGRRLDFLAQEFNREANTLCSKSSSSTLTAIGLELKTVIDQLREQVQNVE